ncbi:MAG: hypothetical protein ACPL7D_04965 [Candidatus Sumerlaeaceae bacterium]
MTDKMNRFRQDAVGVTAALAVVATLAGCERHEVSSTPKPSAAEAAKMPVAAAPVSAEATPAPSPSTAPSTEAETTSTSETSNAQ